MEAISGDVEQMCCFDVECWRIEKSTTGPHKHCNMRKSHLVRNMTSVHEFIDRSGYKSRNRKNWNPEFGKSGITKLLELSSSKPKIMRFCSNSECKLSEKLISISLQFFLKHLKIVRNSRISLSRCKSMQ